MKNVPLSLSMAAAAGGFTLLRPADWSPGMRRAYVFVPGAAAGTVAALSFRKGARTVLTERAGAADLAPVTAGTLGAAADADAATAAASPARKTVVAVAGAVIAGTTASGVLALSLVLDERIEIWLVRRGVARPRRVMAVVAALSSLILDVIMDAKEAKDSKPRQ
ncbi:hypothetical protein N2K95_14220 [Arthrobacter zhaoxinii]|uniref:Peptidase S9 n=1 Tax=Arthrobacter zhaoxinii TaxID=2964616 RepID=A0ABY5YR36_9MICC|nr:hypothetical protein [Arthrobacter zhaoxinii]UWX96779.1 hypothetical protein N2K95_14220 [Arthrobacter zhaoxinii]